MAIPQLNMDGYLLKQIKAETARANAADAQLQGQIDALSGGAIEQSIATTDNGFRLLSADELIYINGSSTVDSPNRQISPTKQVVGSNAFYWGGYSVPFTAGWSDTDFNKGKPYLCVLGFSCYISGTGGGIKRSTVEVSPRDYGYVEQDCFTPGYQHTIVNPSGTRQEMVSFSPPFYVTKDNRSFPFWGFKIDVENYTTAENPTITVTTRNPYNWSQLVEDYMSILIYVNFPKETD